MYSWKVRINKKAEFSVETPSGLFLKHWYIYEKTTIKH